MLSVPGRLYDLQVRLAAVLTQADEGAVELRSHDEGHGGEVQPDQKHDHSADGSIEHGIIGKVVHVHGVQPAQQQPGGQGGQGARPDIPPGLPTVLGQGVEDVGGKQLVVIE